MEASEVVAVEDEGTEGGRKACLLKYDSFNIGSASICGPSDGWESLSSGMRWDPEEIFLESSSIIGVVVGQGLEADLGEERENPQGGQVSVPVPAEPHWGHRRVGVSSIQKMYS